MTDSFDRDAWEARIIDHRAEKDAYFTSDPESPIPESDRDTFEGLEYFSLDPAFRIQGRYEARNTPETVRIGATSGPDIEFEHVGNVGIDLDGELHVLPVYRAPGIDDGLIPFRDKTNGSKTWEHGRYLSVEIPMDADTQMIVDFNLAYHPFSVYNDRFVSAIPPKESELPVSIRAGERL